MAKDISCGVCGEILRGFLKGQLARLPCCRYTVGSKYIYWVDLYHLPCLYQQSILCVLFHPINSTWFSLRVMNTELKMCVGRKLLHEYFGSENDQWIPYFHLGSRYSKTIPLHFSTFFFVCSCHLKKNIGYHLFGETKESKDGLLWQSLATIKLPLCWTNIFTFCHQSLCLLKTLLAISC